ncbi:MAG TPA: pilus assembly protein [Rhizobiaceae bacterium]|nr:pilus assembly protein [Rhizobiaceae bacterium]
MKTVENLRSLPQRARKLARRFAGETSAVAAIEFAFIAPILIAMYMGTIEIANAIDTNKRVGRVSALIADLITQKQNIDKDEIEAITKIGSKTLYPYFASAPSFEIVHFEVTDEASPKAKVVWSVGTGDFDAMPYSQDDLLTDVPAELMVRDSFLVRVTTDLEYRVLVTWVTDVKTDTTTGKNYGFIEMGETYYYRPRLNNKEIKCDDCPT